MEVPVLQILHISDLHVSEGVPDKAMLAREGRRWRLVLRQTIQRHNWFEWHEGTLAHDETAEARFEEALRDLRAFDDAWFGGTGTQAPQTWLVDTGDLSTYGDHASIQAGWHKLQRWRAALGNCPMRVLYGNHDAWPGTLPGLAGGGWRRQAELQRSRLAEYPEWWQERWLNPLCVDIPDTDHQIELYALNSISFDVHNNLRAIGTISQEALQRLALAIQHEKRRRPSSKSYRILATHHPVAFPYDPDMTSVPWLPLIKTMHLAGADTITAFLKHDTAADIPPDLTPYIHLFLAGHTHASFPGTPLPRTVKEAYHGPLGERQMQCVVGPLMLVRDRQRVAQGRLPQIIDTANPAFPQSKIYDANQQCEILRFFYRPDSGDGLYLRRSVLARMPNEGEYRVVPELESEHEEDATALLL